MIPFFSLFVQYQHDIHPTILLSGLLNRAGPRKHVICPAHPIPTQGLDMRYRPPSGHRGSKSAGSLRYSSHNNCHARCPIRRKVPPPRRSMQPRHSYRSGARTAVASHCLPQAAPPHARLAPQNPAESVLFWYIHGWIPHTTNYPDDCTRLQLSSHAHSRIGSHASYPTGKLL